MTCGCGMDVAITHACPMLVRLCGCGADAEATHACPLLSGGRPAAFLFVPFVIQPIKLEVVHVAAN